MTPDRLKEIRRNARNGIILSATDTLFLLDLIDRQREALAGMLDNFGGYCCPEVDTAITVMQEAGIDRWSMQSQIESTFEIPK